MAVQHTPGTLVAVRGRQWMVVDAKPPLLTLRPLAGGEETIIHTGVEKPQSVQFAPPDKKDIGHYGSARLLSDAVRLKLKDGAGAFRSMGRLSFDPRSYQYVPLLMAMQLGTVRLLISDDVGIGKTIEAGMIAAELLARRDIERIAVLCPPHLCDQWQVELAEKFNITAQTVTAARAPKLEREVPTGERFFDYYKHTVISLDFIKSETRRHEFAQKCPEFVIVDEAHTRILRKGGKHQGYRLLEDLAKDENRHMVFLTATPHSGDDEVFYNLLTLLNSEFSQFKEATDNRRRQLRERLARHFVQRMRHDIQESAQENPFPERQEKEAPYIAANSPYGEFLHEVLSYCGRACKQTENRMTYWSMLALMRCVSSSPQAAAVTLNNRIAGRQEDAASDEESEDELKHQVMDGGAGEDTSSDLTPDLTVDGTADEIEALRQFARRAEEIAAEGNEPKFAKLCAELDALLQDGRSPIIFCRYIATAEYLAEHLKKKYDTYTVRAVTGDIPPSARAEQVEELGSAAQRILVATDCLSEGINLQDYFDSVIHYDLSWNPTRHQQREGRVDRLGQRSRVVHTCILYGGDNPVDGAVLEVIIRKAEKIRRELGVAVPVPDEAENITDALLRGIMARAAESQQRQLFSEFFQEEGEKMERLLDKTAGTVKHRRTLFAQNRIKPKEVFSATKEVVEKLGGAYTTERFVCAALRELGMNVSITQHDGAEERKKITVGYEEGKCPGLATWLSDKENHLVFNLPAAPKSLYLHRAHPMVRYLAELFFESSLLSEPKHAFRAGAYFNAEVQEVTTIAIVRMRHQLHTDKQDIQLAEEAAIVRISGVNSPQVQEDEEVLLLLDAEPAGNILPERRELEVSRAKERVLGMEKYINDMARRRAEELRQAHERVRKGVALKGNITAIKKAEALPPDLIGVYVALPRMTGND